jgi:hypothetical protein
MTDDSRSDRRWAAHRQGKAIMSDKHAVSIADAKPVSVTYVAIALPKLPCLLLFSPVSPSDDLIIIKAPFYEHY